MSSVPTERVLRVAIIGGGKMAQHHARAIERLADRARVVAVIDPVAEARDEMLALCPGAEAHESLDGAIRAREFDVVHICSPPFTHAALAGAALVAGCNVYVEKPFTHTREEAQQLAALASERGLVVWAGHQLLFETPAATARELLPALGRIVHIESYFSFRPVRRARGGGAPMRTEDQLLDILPHPVYLLLAFLRAAEPAGETELRSIRVGRAGTVHALIGRGELDASLVVTLAGRPVESYLRLVGDNGQLTADFVRGTTQRLIGPGSSGIDKLLNPFRLAGQLCFQTTRALAGRFLRKRRSYPGLVEAFSAFYDSVRTGAPPVMRAEEIVETVAVCEEIAATLPADPPTVAADSTARRSSSGGTVAVTGGTGFLGRPLVRLLSERGLAVRALARRIPASWERVNGVEYVVADLGAGVGADALRGAHTVIHCAAETAGGWDEHQRNSLEATENLLRAAAAAGVRRIIHVSSLAVVASTGTRVSEATPLLDAPRSRGPYAWGKLESEVIARRLSAELGLDLRIVRPGALVDFDRFEPPGRLGRRVGNLFVAVGSRRDELGITSLRFCSEALAWMALNFERTPDALNLLEPEVPSKGSLVKRLRTRNPGIHVVWLPRVLLHPLSWLAILLQKLLRPGTPAINVARVFAAEKYDAGASAELAERMRAVDPTATGDETTPDTGNARRVHGDLVGLEGVGAER